MFRLTESEADTDQETEGISEADQALQNLLIGTWTESFPETGLIATYRYLPNGKTSIMLASAAAPDTTQALMSGTWYVEDGFLYYEIDSSTLPEAIPQGFASGVELMGASQEEITYKSEQGDIKIMRRQN